MIIQLNAEHPQPRRIAQVVDVLKNGGLVAYPTDTVYGIGCDIFNKHAVERLQNLVREIKGQPDHSPLSFICRDLSNISEYAHVNDFAYRTLRRMLPGPYTFILEATKLVPKVMLNKRKTVGIRVPESAIALALIEELGNPVANTSATHPDGELIPDPWTIEELYGHSVDLIVDGGYVFPEPSTVIDFSGDLPQLIRKGKGPVGDLEYVELI
ncbi:threonylcarbamoyl-AMP synthase [Lujinxingia litoralis]|uniref:Threonylcarbamoyl-AMP synthase n=1 Tax=Lujinxingia litoralis TaxID=2211119 RepID=A0A328C4Q0_9DELT|nr:L-threonylcarbamoyladenylate synthase [Lujinxingia litoralis]RAL21719.1 threonylcarbamoyl-AMP synthase [Lujinxingia litoralis]